MKISIDMEPWELATVIKGLTINAQPEEKKPSGTGWITNLKPEAKSVLSDKTREELNFRKKRSRKKQGVSQKTISMR